MADTNLQLVITADDKAALASIARLSRSVENAGKEAERTDKKAAGMASSFRDTVKALAGLAAIGAAARTVGTFFQQSVAGAQEAEKASVRLETALKRIGQGQALASLKEYAGELQKLAAVDDDLIISQMGVLATFGFNEKQIKRLTKVALDLSARMEVDLPQAIKIVGRAAQGNTLILNKMGIQLELSKDKTIAAAQAVDQLEARFRGAASASAQTFEGRMRAVNLSVDDFKQAVGEAITTNNVFRGILTAVSDEVDGLTGDLGSAEKRSTALNGAFLALIKGAVFLAKSVVAIKAAFEFAGNGAAAYVAAIGQGFSGAASFIAGIFAFLEDKVNDARAAIDNLLNRPPSARTNFFGNIQNEAALLAKGFENTLDASIKNINTSLSATQKEWGALDEIEKKAIASQKLSASIGGGGGIGDTGGGGLGGSTLKNIAATAAATDKVTIVLNGQKLTLEKPTADAVEKAFLAVLEKTGQRLQITAAHSNKIQIAAEQASNQAIRDILAGFGLSGTGKAQPNLGLLPKGRRVDAGIPPLPAGLRASDGGAGPLPGLGGLPAQTAGRSFQFTAQNVAASAEREALAKFKQGLFEAMAQTAQQAGALAESLALKIRAKGAAIESENVRAGANLAKLFENMQSKVDEVIYRAKQAGAERAAAPGQAAQNVALLFQGLQSGVDQTIYQNRQDAEAVKARRMEYERLYKLSHDGFSQMASDLANGQSLWQSWSNRVKQSIQEAIVKLLAMKAAQAVGAGAGAGGGGVRGFLGSLLSGFGGGGLAGIAGGGAAPIGGGMGDFVSLAPMGRRATAVAPSSVNYKVGGTIRLENTNGQAVDVNNPELINAIVAYSQPVAKQVFHAENAASWNTGGMNQTMMRRSTK